MITLAAPDLMLAAGLVLVVALLSILGRLGLARDLLVAALRMTAQLLLLGLVLKTLFLQTGFWWMALMALVMLLMAGHEIRARQKRRLSGGWSFASGTVSVFLSAFSVTVFALLVIVQPKPWYEPQYAIPLLGMILGKTMSAVALALDRMSDGAWQQRKILEQRLMLGQEASEASRDLRRDAVRTAMIPIINAMAVSGVVSLPGSMTGQILAGAEPFEAVRYQILIMFLAAAASGLGVFTAVWLASHRLFDGRQRLRLDHLAGRD